ncbi:MAG: cation diffusion facilitator family transporter, partial [Gemmatimonadetes bacterium]|nr:cation diffusion facilitator family transporter [Gemmatimonadota bacterium]
MGSPSSTRPATAARAPDDPLRAQRLAQLGLVANVALAMAKLVAGVVGNSYALVADAIESSTDMLGSLVVWSGLRIARRDPDDVYPFGYGRAEAVAAATVAVMMLGAAVGIAVEAVREIRTPHHAPAPWTLAVLAAVIVVKELLSRLVAREARATGSVAVTADAGHHRA